MSDDLASDSADEKAIKRARKEALASITKRKEKRKQDFRNKSRPIRRGSDAQDRWAPKPFYERYFNRTFDRKKHEVCFRCGKEGHWQNACQNIVRK